MSEQRSYNVSLSQGTDTIVITPVNGGINIEPDANVEYLITVTDAANADFIAGTTAEIVRADNQVWLPITGSGNDLDGNKWTVTRNSNATPISNNSFSIASIQGQYGGNPWEDLNYSANLKEIIKPQSDPPDKIRYLLRCNPSSDTINGELYDCELKSSILSELWSFVTKFSSEEQDTDVVT